MISLIDPQVQDLALVKIKLLEAKSDFVEAFMSYLNNERMHKNLFQWLLDTFESLTKKQAQLLQKKRSADMKFDSGKSGAKAEIKLSREEQEKQRRIKEAMGSSSDEDEAKPKAAAGVSGSES